MALGGTPHWGGAAGPPSLQRESCGPRVSPHTPTPTLHPLPAYPGALHVPRPVQGLLRLPLTPNPNPNPDPNPDPDPDPTPTPTPTPNPDPKP